MIATRDRLQESINRVLSESYEFRDAGPSPLTYARASNVQRLALCDPSVTNPPAKGDTYFAHIERWRRFSKRGKRLKRPVLDEVIPGVDDNCIVGFLDYHPYGPDGWYIDYVSTRRDQRGRGYARALVEKFYEQHSDAKLVHWGKMMQPSIGHLLSSMQEKYPDINSIGSKYW